MEQPSETVHGRLLLPRTKSVRYENLEYSVHVAPRLMVRELRNVFGGVEFREESTLVVPTCQMSSVSLINWGPEEAREKDRLLERFLVWAGELRKEIVAAGHWADFTDPCSGLAYHGRTGGSIYPDVDGFERLLHYKIDGSMGCRIMLHPEWQFAAYPATFFTTAPAEKVLALLSTLNA